MDLLPQLYILVIGRKTDSGFIENYKKTVNLEDNAYSRRGKTYNYKAQDFTHQRGRRHYGYFDIDTQERIKYDWMPEDVNAEDSDTRNARGLVRTAIQNATSSYGLAMVILAGAAGLGAGLFVGYLVAGMM